MGKLLDRLDYAARLAEGKRVLDIGGQKMPDCDPDSPFASEYARIEKAASEYRIVDYQRAPEVDYVIDLNTPEGVEMLGVVIDEYKPELILCMETLEHLNYHFEVMNVMAEGVSDHRSTVFLTVPNNANWVFNALGWNHDHCVAFFRDIAERFVTRSNLGKHEVAMHPCMQKYLWYWWIAYLVSFCQPFSWGATIKPKT